MKRVIVCSVSIIVAMVLMIIAQPRWVGSQVKERAPDFSLNDIQGAKHSLSDYSGKVVVINFWASWCPECVDELPSLNALYEKYVGKGLIVIGIATDRKRDSVEPLLKRSRVTYPIFLNTVGGTLLKQYRIIGLPSTVVIDSNGNITERSAGRTDFGSSDFTRKIESLLDSAIKR